MLCLLRQGSNELYHTDVDAVLNHVLGSMPFYRVFLPALLAKTHDKIYFSGV